MRLQNMIKAALKKNITMNLEENTI